MQWHSENERNPALWMQMVGASKQYACTNAFGCNVLTIVCLAKRVQATESERECPRPGPPHVTTRHQHQQMYAKLNSPCVARSSLYFLDTKTAVNTASGNDADFQLWVIYNITRRRQLANSIRCTNVITNKCAESWENLHLWHKMWF